VFLSSSQAKNILSVCSILKEKYEGDIPGTFDELMALPGVGPKMVSHTGSPDSRPACPAAAVCLWPSSRLRGLCAQATLVMSYGWGQVVGITVDTHVHRIANRLQWVNTWNAGGKSQNPEKTRKTLEKWLPRDLW
jgi:endonuclease III